MFKPTVNCGQLRKEDAGQEAVLAGWVASWRDHGGVVFIDLRDIHGITQIVFGRKKSGLSADKEKALISRAHDLRNEYVIAVKGLVNMRPPGTENKNISTGSIEVAVTELELLNASRELPFDMKNMKAVGEETRLKYRYLELRAGRLKDNLIFKHRLYQFSRNFFSSKEFYEVETPYLTRSTPEGARDFLVPSRLNPGKFYAMPQSPQLFKQLFMVGGLMRYFQIVKCFRDEDFRQDRQPEFTQLDLEMSFIDEKDIKDILEEYMCGLFKELMGIALERPFPSLSYADVMLKYGTDKPDLRSGLEIRDITELASGCGFKVFKTAAQDGAVRGLKINDPEGKLSLSVIDKLTQEIRPLGARGLAWMRHKDEGLQSQITKFFSEEELAEIADMFGSKPGDIIFFIADSEPVACACLGYLRRKFIEPAPDKYSILWVEDYPLFEKDAETGRLNAMHHPFTAPDDRDIEMLDADASKVRSRAYDLVLNGSEIGGGSIRNHSMEIQQKIFGVLNMDREESRRRFGFLLDALNYGAPPHGGFAFGLDRLSAKLLGLDSIRDVIPFPKTQKAVSPLTGAPSGVDVRQLKELNIELDLPENGGE